MLKRFYMPLALIVLLALSACSGNQADSPEVIPDTPVAPTAQPSPTPSPPPVPLAVIFAPADSNPGTLAQVQPVVEQAASQAGLMVEVHQNLDPGALPAGLKLVVAIPPAANLPDLIAAAPNTQFIAMAVPGLAPSPNLTEITGGGQRSAKTGFLAGYTAAILTEDYRVGAIYSANDPAYGTGFINGARYFCGLCQQQYPPFYDYPLTGQISAGAGPGEWQVVADQLISYSVKTMFVAPDINDPALYEYLAQNGIMFIGGSTPPESVNANWLGTISLDTGEALAGAIPLVLNSGGQGQINTTLTIQPGGSGLLGNGYLMNLNEIAGQLEEGNISPGVQ